jgi:hypothetical protein
MTFQQWLEHVDDEISAICGLSHNDLGDQCWHDWFDDELSPKEAAMLCLENEGFPFDALL